MNVRCSKMGKYFMMCFAFAAMTGCKHKSKIESISSISSQQNSKVAMSTVFRNDSTIPVRAAAAAAVGTFDESFLSDYQLDLAIKELISLAGISPFALSVKVDLGKVSVKGQTSAASEYKKIASLIPLLAGVREFEDNVSIVQNSSQIEHYSFRQLVWDVSWPLIALVIILAILIFAINLEFRVLKSEVARRLSSKPRLKNA